MNKAFLRNIRGRTILKFVQFISSLLALAMYAASRARSLHMHICTVHITCLHRRARLARREIIRRCRIVLRRRLIRRCRRGVVLRCRLISRRRGRVVLQVMRQVHAAVSSAAAAILNQVRRGHGHILVLTTQLRLSARTARMVGRTRRMVVVVRPAAAVVMVEVVLRIGMAATTAAAAVAVHVVVITGGCGGGKALAAAAMRARRRQAEVARKVLSLQGVLGGDGLVVNLIDKMLQSIPEESRYRSLQY